MAQKVDFVPYNFNILSEPEMIQRAQDFYDRMSNRRTVREFSSKPIPENIVEQAVATAGTAPSGANKQPWHFCVIKDSDIKQKIREAAEAEEKENYERRFSEEMKKDLSKFETNFIKEYLTNAPALVVVFKQSYEVIDGVRYKNYYVNESVGIATGMLIAALHNAGLATLTHTPNPMKFLNKILDRPDNETPIVLMPVGYPADNAKVPDIDRKSLDEIMTRF